MENARIWKGCTEPRGAERCLRSPCQTRILRCRRDDARANIVCIRIDDCMQRPIWVWVLG